MHDITATLRTGRTVRAATTTPAGAPLMVTDAELHELDVLLATYAAARRAGPLGAELAS